MFRRFATIIVVGVLGVAVVLATTVFTVNADSARSQGGGSDRTYFVVFPAEFEELQGVLAFDKGGNVSFIAEPLSGDLRGDWEPVDNSGFSAVFIHGGHVGSIRVNVDGVFDDESVLGSAEVLFFDDGEDPFEDEGVLVDMRTFEGRRVRAAIF